jgi:hypothetical protein
MTIRYSEQSIKLKGALCCAITRFYKHGQVKSLHNGLLMLTLLTVSTWGPKTQAFSLSKFGSLYSSTRVQHQCRREHHDNIIIHISRYYKEYLGFYGNAAKTGCLEWLIWRHSHTHSNAVLVRRSPKPGQQTPALLAYPPCS